MDLVAARSARPNQAGLLEHGEVLRDRLPGCADAMPHRESGADLEQRLPVAIGQLVQDRAPRLVGECPVDVTHAWIICKFSLACQCQAGQPAFTTCDEPAGPGRGGRRSPGTDDPPGRGPGPHAAAAPADRDVPGRGAHRGPRSVDRADGGGEAASCHRPHLLARTGSPRRCATSSPAMPAERSSSPSARSISPRPVVGRQRLSQPERSIRSNRCSMTAARGPNRRIANLT